MAAYGMSKAAALVATTKFAVKLKDEGFIVISLNPGLVDVSGTTGGSGKPILRMYVIGIDWQGLGNLRDTALVSRWSAKFGASFELMSPEASVSK